MSCRRYDGKAFHRQGAAAKRVLSQQLLRARSVTYPRRRGPDLTAVRVSTLTMCNRTELHGTTLWLGRSPVLYEVASFAASTSTLVIPSTRRTTLGDRAFPVTAARAWNALPSFVRSAPSLLQFRRDLKTALFQSSYSSP